MLSDEEKKALERIDYIQDFIIENGQYNADVNDMEYFSKILNLIEKQSKEIEELKAINKMQKYRIEVIDEREFISKDTIKAKIQECREILYSFEKELELKANKEKYIHKESMNCLLSQISILQSLLEKE